MKKILSLALAAVMLVSVLPVAYAADTADYTAGTTVEYTAANTTEYSITVPALLAPGDEGTVTLAGTWASNETITITADAEVELTNSINAADKHTLAVTFPAMKYAGNNTEAKTYTETVAIAEMPSDALFGTWSGVFNYNVESLKLIKFTIDGSDYVGLGEFNAEEGMTWSEWTESKYDTGYYGVYSGEVRTSNGKQVCHNGSYVKPSDVIVHNTTYTLNG